MSITVELNSDEIAQMTRFTNQQDGARAVAQAAREYLRICRLRELSAMSGLVDYDDDPCIWVSFFTRPSSREKLAVDELLATDRAALLGPVVAEVLRGFRRREQADWAASRLRLTHYVTAEWDDWRQAADLGREQAKRGRDLPITDLALAAVALRLDAHVYTTDPHFDGIDGLKRFWPA